MANQPPTNTSWPWLPRPMRARSMLQYFLKLEAAGGIVLLIAAVGALIWANVWTEAYESFWHIHAALKIEGFHLDQDLGHWVNDALMVIFFFLVGLEIKREFVTGELHDPKRAALPLLGAIGGMAVPALFFFAFTNGTDAISGWGIPVATDIAFVIGVLALFGRRLPTGLRVFLLTLAIADDIGGIAIIAIFYSSDLAFDWLTAALGLIILIFLMQRARIVSFAPYIVVGAVLWYATFESGIHATIAGVILGLLTPARPFQGENIMEKLEHLLLPWSNFVIIPLFALANAGVVISGESLSDAFGGRLAWGVLVGLVGGKFVGISLLTIAGIVFRIGRLPSAVTIPHVLGAAALAGIGFTVSLFIAELSFKDSASLLDQAKMGVIFGSLIAGILGAVLLLIVSKKSPPVATSFPVVESASEKGNEVNE